MNKTEFSLLVAIGGFLLLFEGLITLVARTFFKGHRNSEEILKSVAGLVILAFGIIYSYFA